VPAGYGGADVFGWHPENDGPVADLGDLCVNEMANLAPQDGVRRLIQLRLYPSLDLGTTQAEQGDSPSPSVGSLVKELHALIEAGEDYETVLSDLLASLRAQSLTDPLMAATVQELVKASPRVTVYPPGVVLTARVRSHFFEASSGAIDTTEDATDADDSSSLRGGMYQPAPVTLKDHAEGVVRWVDSFTQGLGLDGGLAAVLRRSAALHDLGKADHRFQFLLYGDEPGDQTLAKSGRDLDMRQREAVHRRSCLPDGFRHELVSVAFIRNHRHELLAEIPEKHHDLVEYLIGVHHGRGRPFMPVIAEKEPERVMLSWEGFSLSANPDHGLGRLESGWTDGFWKLVRTYGYWGLAYLEALLRLADGARSAEEQRLQEESR